MKTKLNQSKLKGAIVSAMLVGTAALSVPASAGTGVADMTVSADIGMNCTISTTNISFGAYNPIDTHASAALNADGAVSTTCTVGSTGKIIIGQGLDPATGSTDAAPARRMGGPGEADYLNYQVYSDSSLASVWTNEVASGVGYTASGSAQVLLVHGSVPGGQTSATEGSYSDTLVVTVNY